MGYFTASVEWAKNTGQPDAWKDWWYDPQARIYNFIGKDNIPFHTIIWPAELLGVDGIYQTDATPAHQPAVRRAGQRVHEHRGRQIQQEPQVGDLAAGHPESLRSGPDPLST